MIAQHLTGHHRTTLAQIFSHPLAHNLDWNAVTSLVGAIGTVEERHNGEFAFAVGEQRGFFHKPHGKHLEGNDVARLRTFLEHAGVTAESVPADEAPAKGSAASSTTFVVVADHHHARIFSLESDTLTETKKLEPADPAGFRRHLEHKKEADYAGERIPEDRAYYESIAAELKGTEPILLIGDATGKSSATAYLSEFLSSTHNDVFRRVVGTLSADLSALTDGKVHTLARDFFAKPTPA